MRLITPLYPRPATQARRCRRLLAGCGWAAAVTAIGAAMATAVVTATAAPREDPMQSTACAAAQKRLAAAEGPASQRPALSSRSPPSLPSPPAALTQAKRETAVACLGEAALNQPVRAGQVRQPLSVPPVRVAGQGGGVASPLPAGAPPRLPGVVSVTSCDANGCWSSDGTRLARDGLLLQGPRGACTTTGVVLNCP